VQFTLDTELGRVDVDSTGVIVSEDGLVITSIALTRQSLPDEQMKNFKIILPADPETEIDATFQGRDERVNLAFYKINDSSAATKRTWKPITFDEAASKSVRPGDEVFSVGVMPKPAGYKPYLMRATTSAVLRGPVPQVLVTGEGLAAVGAPVFNAEGKAIGVVQAQADQSPFLNDPRNPMGSVFNPPRMFVPAHDFVLGLKDPPTGQALSLAFSGMSQLTGLTKEVAEYYGLKDQPAVQVGDVIPGFAAEKAGVKPGDVIIKLDGEPLERGDQPEETWRILTRKISRKKVGQDVTFTLISAKDQPPREVKLTLVERPKPASRAKRFWAEDMGFTVREIVFDDTYERKLDRDTGGGVVALIKPNSSAQTARLAIGDLITQFNGQPIKTLDEFKEQYEAFRKEKPNEAVVLEVIRGTNTQVIRIEPPQ
ncbi:MAG: PDZ domain-containing protein, partial [Anaerolineae bacterium]|nr:PDZ domain-containing protein [Phycisphaerae bacterium]